MKHRGQSQFFSDEGGGRRKGAPEPSGGEATTQQEPLKPPAENPPNGEATGFKFDAISEKLLLSHESVRDPIHGDIWITLLERQLIDTKDFQRLRGIAQLGPVSLLYPGAVHTRFSHSLGTVYVAQLFVEICNRNAETGNLGRPQSHALQIDPYPHLLVRLYALLHDVAHIPFGHTLSQEGNLMPDEWADTKKAARFFGEGSEIRGQIETALRRLKIEDWFTRKLVTDLYRLLTHKDKDDPMELEYPYVRDLVVNTVCADLWDYLERDMYYCGLKERSGDRFINYLAILPLKRIRVSPTDAEDEPLEVFQVCPGEKGRAVLLAFRYERDREDIAKLNPVEKPDVLSEAIDMLRRRYSLAEKVYFHRTKIAASSMLISAVASSKPFKEKAETFYGKTESEFLKEIVTDADPRCSSLAKAYCGRQLFKPIYRIAYRPLREEDTESRDLWNDIYDRFRDYKQRLKAEASLEKEFDLLPGSVSIYCPDKKMNLKEFRVLVALHPNPPFEVKPLKHILDEPRRNEMKAIRDRFLSLWTLDVFVDPTKLDPAHRENPKVHLFSGACESRDFFGLPNDLHPQLRNKSHDRLRSAADDVVKLWQREHNRQQVPYDTYQDLVGGEHRDPEGPLRDHLYAKLCGLMEREKT